jgi:hypothetical protein
VLSGEQAAVASRNERCIPKLMTLIMHRSRTKFILTNQTSDNMDIAGETASDVCPFDVIHARLNGVALLDMMF